MAAICGGDHVVSQNLVSRRQRMTIDIGGSGVHRAFFFQRANARLTVRWCTIKPKRSAMRLPEGIERSLVDIVAAMAFATALESVT